MSTDATMDLFASQWSLCRMQLVNWGTFCGYHDFPVVTKSANDANSVVMITGESGTGKSTLFDAKTAVMMKSSVRFNSASNRAGAGPARGKRERNLYSYLMGKQDDEIDPETGEEHESYLRSSETAQWSAIVLTFSSDEGAIYSCARFYYISAHADPGEFDTFYVTLDDQLDPRYLEPFVASRITRKTLREAYPASTIYDGPTAFLRGIYSKLDIGEGGEGDSAMALHERIQSGYPLTDVDALFKDLVIDEPSTYAIAADAIEAFHEHESIWVQMEEVRQKLAALAGIREDMASYVERSDDVDLLESLQIEETVGPLGLWFERRQEEVARKAHREQQRQSAALAGRIEHLDQELAQRTEEFDRLQREVIESGGDAIDRLTAEVKDARAEVARRTEQHEKLASHLAQAQRALPADAAGYDALRTESQAFVASYDEEMAALDGRRTDLLVRRRETNDKLEELEGQLGYYRAHPVNITPRMAQARDAIAKAAGMDPEQLPYAAELLDMADGEEQWRLAANIGYHGLLTLMLVDARMLDALSEKINTMKLDMRVNFYGVDLSRDYQAQPRAGSLSSKVIVRHDSPFAAWVAWRTCADDLDCICVEGPRNLAGVQRKITREGQTRKGQRGAHGYNPRDTLIMGFTNRRLLAELEEQRRTLLADSRSLQADIDAMQSEQRAMRMRDAAARWVIDHGWETVDVAGAKDALARVEHELDALMHDDRLHELIERRDEARAAWQELQGTKAVAQRDLEQVKTLVDALASSIDQHAQAARRIEGQGVDVTSRQQTTVDELARERESTFMEDGNISWVNLARGYDALSNGVRSDIRQRIASQRRMTTILKDKLEKTFGDYKARWLGLDDPTGTSVESFPDYLRMLESLEHDKLNEPQGKWLSNMLRLTGQSLVPLANAYTDDLRETRRRMTPINQIMSRFDFGPWHGRLQIITSERTPASISAFRGELRQWASLATAADLDEDAAARRHEGLRRFMAKLQEGLSARDKGVLNTKRLVRITVAAHYPQDCGRPDNSYASLDAKSGGETQELIAFILGAALLFCLGDNGQTLPSFAPVFLDEAFIKADERYTRRAIQALTGLGFQVIIAVPTSKVQAVEPVADQYVCIAKDDARHSYIVPMVRSATHAATRALADPDRVESAGASTLEVRGRTDG